ncbi:MAG: signal peptidase II [Coriobacteriia bacterium]|nr:signal peptidase II [Coriobacteriia bacterium]
MTKRRAIFLAATMFGIIVADQVTKGLVRATMELGESRPVIEGILWLTRVKNTGAAFGMLRDHQWLLVSVAVVVLAAIGLVVVRFCPESGLARTALAMIAAGASGNLIDRVFLGGVTDFLDAGWWPVFNVADVSLDIGVALLVFWLIFGHEHRTSTSTVPSADAVPECMPNAARDGD